MTPRTSANPLDTVDDDSLAAMERRAGFEAFIAWRDHRRVSADPEVEPVARRAAEEAEKHYAHLHAELTQRRGRPPVDPDALRCHAMRDALSQPAATIDELAAARYLDGTWLDSEYRNAAEHARAIAEIPTLDDGQPPCPYCHEHVLAHRRYL